MGRYRTLWLQYCKMLVKGSSEEIKKYDTSDEIYYSVLRPNVSISLYGHLDGNYVVVKIVITDDELKKEQ